MQEKQDHLIHSQNKPLLHWNDICLLKRHPPSTPASFQCCWICHLEHIMDIYWQGLRASMNTGNYSCSALLCTCIFKKAMAYIFKKRETQCIGNLGGRREIVGECCFSPAQHSSLFYKGSLDSPFANAR